MKGYGRAFVRVVAAGVVVIGLGVGGGAVRAEKAGKAISFSRDVYPIIKQHCLPCHAEDNFNPSELSLDTYDDLIQGGKHGSPVKAGNAKESLLIKKLGADPPFGDRMPLNTKEKIREGKAKYLSEQEIKLIATWIDEGGKKN